MVTHPFSHVFTVFNKCCCFFSVLPNLHNYSLLQTAWTHSFFSFLLCRVSNHHLSAALRTITILVPLLEIYKYVWSILPNFEGPVVGLALVVALAPSGPFIALAGRLVVSVAAAIIITLVAAFLAFVLAPVALVGAFIACATAFIPIMGAFVAFVGARVTFVAAVVTAVVTPFLTTRRRGR
ncbi:hypothetical protein QBC46DRAFT_374233 [Diplogelasinospora grovesii]|uniref:Uncharacterized protein n=1 Tax=Diplogelasinospora grovesii TaxID=303347 RepID=A0AAN6NFW2_9PEZI|nr:hypothetical protein QBC46DRAFT_374233 [Diplogelasinospora grovesii]